jgi:hypothetical protein
MDWHTLSQYAIPILTSALAVIGALAPLAGRARRAAKREHDLFRRLRAADLEMDDPVHNGRLQAWYGELTGHQRVSPAEIRYASGLEPFRDALVDYASARAHLKLVSEAGEHSGLAFRYRVMWGLEIGFATVTGLASVFCFLMPFTLSWGSPLTSTQQLAIVAFFYAVGTGFMVMAAPFIKTTFAVRRVLKLQDLASKKAATLPAAKESAATTSSPPERQLFAVKATQELEASPTDAEGPDTADGKSQETGRPCPPPAERSGSVMASFMFIGSSPYSRAMVLSRG